MKWQSPTLLASFALFVIWMERRGRWTLFLQAMAGEYTVGGARGTPGVPPPNQNTVSTLGNVIGQTAGEKPINPQPAGSQADQITNAGTLKPIG